MPRRVDWRRNMSGEWFIYRNELKIGPFTKDQLREFAAAGRIQSTDLIYVPTREQWVPATRIRGFVETTTPAPAQAEPRAQGEPRPQTKPVADHPAETPPAPTNEVSPSRHQADQPSLSSYPWRFIGSSIAVTACLSLAVGWMIFAGRRHQAGESSAAEAHAQPAHGRPAAQQPAPGGFRAATPKSGIMRPATPKPGMLNAEYVQLAHLISNSFSVADKPAATNPGEGEATLRALAGSRSPAIRNAVARVKGGQQAALEAKQQVRQGDAQVSGMFADVMKKSMTGGYVRPHKEVRMLPSGREEEVTVYSDESAEPVVGSALLALWVHSRAEGEARSRAAAEVERGRIEAWGELHTDLDRLYPRAAAGTGVITPRAVSPSRTGKPAQFALVNSSGRELTNVTVKLDLVHFLSTPQPYARQIYFVDEWPAGESIDLPTGLIPNVADPNYLAGRPSGTLPADSRHGRKPSAREIWLNGAGGVVDFRIAAWSMELRQSGASVKIPELVELAGRFELDQAFRLASFMYLSQWRNRDVPKNRNVTKNRAPVQPRPLNLMGKRPGRKSAEPDPVTFPPEGFKAVGLTEPKDWSLIAAKRVANFVPEGSEINRDATAYMADPNEFVRLWTIRGFESNAALVQPGKRWKGEWTYRLVSVSPIAVRDVKKALTDFNGRKGPLFLTVDTFDKSTYTFTGTVSDGADRNASRPVSGIVDQNGISFKTQRSTPRPAPPVVAPRSAPRLVLPVLDLRDAPFSFKMTPEGNDLVGTGSAPRGSFTGDYDYSLVVSPVE
jgi:hypothetical protein